MNRMRPAALCIAAAALTAGCSPSITVNNHTPFTIRAAVTQDGSTNVISPSPGESSSVDAKEGGYVVSVLVDQEWLEYAKLTRKVLNDELADPAHLTVAQLHDILTRLNDIAARIDEFQRAAGSAGLCAGVISEGNSVLVEVTTGAGGGLAAVCPRSEE